MNIEHLSPLATSISFGVMAGFLIGYTIKKIMKIAVLVVRLFLVGLVNLSYKIWINVKWVGIENAIRSTLTIVAGQVLPAPDSIASQFTAHPSVIVAPSLPISTAFRFVSYTGEKVTQTNYPTNYTYGYKYEWKDVRLRNTVLAVSWYQIKKENEIK